jgi:hypothetical protein
MGVAPGSKAERKAALDAGAWMFNVVTSVGIIMVNKALMATHGFSFGENMLKSSTSFPRLITWYNITMIMQLAYQISSTNVVCAMVCLRSNNINWAAFCNHDLDDISNEMVGIYSAILPTIARTSKICLLCKSIDCWDEC